MKIKYYFLLFFCCILLCGCGSKDSGKNINQIAEDFKLYAEKHRECIYERTFVEGTVYEDFEIIKRLTDEENNTDTVYLKVKLENDETIETKGYMLSYKKYNEGWMLENMQLYKGDDIEYVYEVKDSLSDDKVLELIKLYSNSVLEAEISEQAFRYESYFFEDGKYTAEVISNDFVEDDVKQSCKGEIQLKREYGALTYEEVLSYELYYDFLWHNWYIGDISVVSNDYKWNLVGTWRRIDSDDYVEVKEVIEEDGEYSALVNVVYESYLFKNKKNQTEEKWNLPKCTSLTIDLPKVKEVDHRLYNITSDSVCIYNSHSEEFYTLVRE